jgi:hypothetical protein
MKQYAGDATVCGLDVDKDYSPSSMFGPVPRRHFASQKQSSRNSTEVVFA